MKAARVKSVFLLVMCVSGVSMTLAAQPSETVLYAFAGTPDGSNPTSNLIFDSDGNLYGTTEFGGALNEGTIFELSNGPTGWTETVLYSFGQNPGDGTFPISNLAFDSAGNLYGTTFAGGDTVACAFGCGVIFRLTPGVNGWTESVSHTFSLVDGANPLAGLIADTQGNFYGTTSGGGAHGIGEVFKFDGSRLQVLHSFAGGNDGANPEAGITSDTSGNLFGTTYSGGIYGGGTVFELSSVGGQWKERVLQTLRAGFGTGTFPQAGLALDGSGNLYGTVSRSGPGQFGGVFELKRLPNAAWKYLDLFAFRGGFDGGEPYGVILGSAGNLYGISYLGGTFPGYGNVFELTPTSNGHWTETVLHSFAGGSDGADTQMSGLVLDSTGNVYGVTFAGGTSNDGIIFEITP